MKFCPVVPEICCGQVHVPKKERKKERRIIIIITRYDYNLTIMKSQVSHVEFVRYCGGHFENGDR
jgi:hypothetical protein